MPRVKYTSPTASQARAEYLDDTLNQLNHDDNSRLSHHHRESSNTCNKSIAEADKDGDWFELFWAKKRLDLRVDSFKYKTGEQLFGVARKLE